MRYLASLLLLSGSIFAQEKKEIEKLAPYYPSPPSIVQRMLEMGGLKPGEKMFDLGSGDGRIVIMAAAKFKANATGIEFDESLYKQSSEEIRKQGLNSTARIVHGDISSRTTLPPT
ncbi:MAG: class I SAM-dependent methyltransferase [Bryobacteraceae bacterium]